MPQDLPPAIVYGGDTSVGLPIVRELGMRGVDVTVLQRHDRGVGRFSRYAARWERIAEGGDARLEQLRRIVKETGAAFILPTSEDFVDFLSTARERDQLPARALCPSREAFLSAMDKVRSQEAVRAAGLPLPVTWEIETLADLQSPPEGFRLPAIVKWRDKGAIWPTLEDAGLPLIKSEYVESFDALGATLRKYEPIGQFPMIQTFAKGIYLGISVLMAGGKAVLTQQEVEVAMWPPEQGIDCVVKAVPHSEHEELRAGVERMLAHLGYEGPACVEFRWDPETRRAVWLEINPRFWGSQPLAHHCGRHFGWWAYSVLGLGKTPESTPTRDDLTARFWIPETRRLVGVMTNNADGGYWAPAAPRPDPWRELAAYAARYVSPRTRYYIWSAKDPGPFLADMGYAGAKAGGLVMDKTRRLFGARARAA